MLKKIASSIIGDFALRKQRAMAITGIDLFYVGIIVLNGKAQKNAAPPQLAASVC
jgi:hypothetical protein